MNELITVIVPVYNVEKYISKCLDSIINQTYKNIEIIIVNNNSTDKSYEICKSYSKKDSRIVLINEKRKGVSNARNAGMNCATGDYIIFIDSDDWLEYDMVECLYRGIVENNADIAICEYYFNTDAEQIANNDIKDVQIIDEKKEMYADLFEENLYGGYLWNKLIKKNIIDTKFYEEIQIQEDMLFLINVIKKTKRLVYMPAKKMYHYRQRNDSAVVFQYSKKDITKLYAMKYIIEIQEQFNLPVLSRTIYDYYMLARKSKYIVKKENIEDPNLKNTIDKISRKYFVKVFKNAKIKEKFKICLFTIFPYICGNIHEKWLSRKYQQ